MMQIQDLYSRFGFEVSIRSSSEHSYRLKCHCAGEPQSTVKDSERKNKSESAKSGCRFFINLYLPECRETVQLTKTQISNTRAVHARYLSKEMLDSIKEMTNNANQLAAIRCKLKEKFDLNYIAPHVIQTAVNRIKVPKQGSQIEQLLKWLDSDPTKFVYRCTWATVERDGQQVNEIGNILFASFQMISLAQHDGQFIVADATYKTNEFGRPLLIFTARAGTGAFAIVAVVLIPSESKENLTWAFGQLRELMGSEAFQRIEVVMTDGDRSYPSILETLLPNTVHQLCWWHQQRNMRPFCGIASDPTECWSLMIEAIKTFDPVEAEATWKEMIDKFFSQSVLQVRATKKSADEAASRKTQRNRLPAWAEELPGLYRKALRLLMDWYDDRHLYWKAYTRGYCNFGSIASQGGESMNNVVKERSFVELDDLMQMTQNVSETQLIVQLDESWKAQERTPLGT
jgi:MULE transposase domain